MPKLVLFLLGQKGYMVLKAAITAGQGRMVRLVVIGVDNNVQEDSSSEIISLCNEHHIKYCSRGNVFEITESAENSIAIAAGWRWMIEFAFTQIIVFHDSLLPKYRGFNPLVTALLNRDSEIGVTAIVANKEFDCGDVIQKKVITLNYPVKVRDVITKVSSLYFELTRCILDQIIENGWLIGTPQDETGASYSVWRDEEDYRIDWKKSAEAIAHFVKCVSFPYKGASTVCEERVIRILEAEPVSDVKIENRGVGKVMFIANSKPVVICGIGLLRIDEAIDDCGHSVLPFDKFRTRLK